MHLTNEVAIPSPPDRVFAVLSDVERVAPCLPGATLDGRGDDEGTYRGRVTVKVGPISAAYSGTVRFLETDEVARTLVLDARGTDQHGSGTAEAKVEVTVRPDGEGSLLALDTDLVIRGKVAQFGGGAIAQVSQRLMEQFARNLSGLLAEGPRTTAPESPAPAAQEAPGTSELDAFSLVVLPLLKRYAPVAAALAAGVLAGRGLRPRNRGVLLDETTTATLTIGATRHRVPVRHVVRLLRR